MTLFTTCTACGARQPIDAGFVGDDGKRLAVLLGDMSPVLARAVVGYLAMFKPAKTELRIGTALKRTQELVALIAAGTVCKDERSDLRRKAGADVWAAGMEQMQAQRASLSLPLDNHHYLRAVVFGLADRAEAQAEQQRETQRQQGRCRSSAGTQEDPITTAIRYAEHMVSLGGWTPEQRDAHIAAARAKHGNAP